MPWGRAGVMKVRRQQTSLHNKEGLLWKAKEEELVMGHQAPQQKVKVKSLSHVRLFVTPWTVAYQAPPSMRFFQARVLEWIAISFSRGSS